MQTANKHTLNEEECPIPEDVLGHLHSSNPADAALVASNLPEAQRAKLAAFCYERRHLHHLGLMIASSCGIFHLKRAFGSAGAVVFQQSRKPEETIAEERRNSHQHFTKPVTLASFAAPGSVETEDDEPETDTDIAS